MQQRSQVNPMHPLPQDGNRWIQPVLVRALLELIPEIPGPPRRPRDDPTVSAARPKMSGGTLLILNSIFSVFVLFVVNFFLLIEQI